MIGVMAELVGVLNLTPNSSTEESNFFAPYYQPEKATVHGEQLFQDGASSVNVGAESTSPGVQPVDPRTEQWRLKPVLDVLVPAHPGDISVDTRHPETARWALEEYGDVIINDVTGMNNLHMVGVVAEYGARCIVSHMVGTDIQAVHHPKTPKITDARVVYYDLRAKHALLVDCGLKPENITLDPGIGFGKTRAVDLELIEAAAELSEFEVMIGYSRKRVIGEYFTMPQGILSKDESRKDLAPNVRAARKAIVAGAAQLRVHDVAGHQPVAIQTPY